MRTMKTPSGDPIAVYQIKDIDDLVPLLGKAREMWSARCDAYLKKHGDQGSCVLGAGIAVPYVGHKGKQYAKRIIISAWSATNAQGSLVWEESVNDIIAFLEQNGVQGCTYLCGRMD